MSVDAIGATPHKLGKLVCVRGDHFRRLEPVLYVLYVLYVCSVLDVLHVGLSTACTAVGLSTTNI